MTQNTLSPNRAAARAYGTLFLLAFLSYGSGSAITDGLASSGLAEIAANQAGFTSGIILMAVVHTLANIGLAVVMLPVIKPFNKTLSYGYYAFAITATLVAIIGAMSLLLLLPLSQIAAETANVDTLTMLLKRGGFYGYQLGMTLWGLGGLTLCTVLYTSRLVPRWLPVWGLIGYLIFMTGTIAELFGYGIGLMLSAPGGLFEIGLSLWLIFKGFNTHTPNPSSKIESN